MKKELKLNLLYFKKMKDEEFYVPYIEGSLGVQTKRTLKRFVFIAFFLLIVGALIFSFSQNAFKNSTFELTDTTEITGVYHENPYPMLRVQIDETTHKNIVLLGFGKMGAHPFLEKIRKESITLEGKILKIEGNLIYYNGKTLLQITDDEKVTMVNSSITEFPKRKTISQMSFQGEIIDPKCYFGVMKPGFGKIHRSCAVRCISGGIPPILATSDSNNVSQYFLLTDMSGEPINREILSYIGKPSEITGVVEQLEDWYLLKINMEGIRITSNNSKIYN